MDDLKLYAPKDDYLEEMLQKVKKFRNDISMKLNLQKMRKSFV